MAAPDDGATPSEILIEACRRNNTSLTHEVLASLRTNPKTAAERTATLINDSRDPTGLAPLHVAARNAAYDVLDILLDQDGVETDPRARRDGKTPLHLAVHWCNEETGPGDWEKEGVFAHVEILLDAGCDPRLRDREGRRPVECVDGRNARLREVLRRGEMLAEAERTGGGDVVVEDEDGEGDRGTGSESD